MSTNPTAEPARFPAEYGEVNTDEGLLPWGDVAARIAASPNYWLATTTDTGRPYQRPVDGVFIENVLAFGGSPETRWVRHLQQRPAASASLPDDDHVVILDGDAEMVADGDLPIAGAVGKALAAKYPQYFPNGPGEFLPFWIVRPRRIFAWSLTGFPARATRFTFDAVVD